MSNDINERINEPEDDLRCFQKMPAVFKYFQPADKQQQSRLTRFPRSLVLQVLAMENLSLASQQ